MEALNIDPKEKKYVTRTAINLETFDKYMPGKQKFFIQALTPTKNKSTEFATVNSDLGNIMNKDKAALGAKLPKVGSCIELEVPKDVTRWFQVKFIPPGKRFIVSFDGGNITNPRIIGRDYNDEQGEYNSDDKNKG